LPVGVSDEGPEGVQHLLLVVKELPLVVLLGLDAKEVVEISRFRRQIFHCFLVAAAGESGGIWVKGNLQIGGS
jgi:hypothetical protein